MNQFRFREYIRERAFRGDLTGAQRAVYQDVSDLADWWCKHSEANQDEVIKTLEEKAILYIRLLDLARSVTEE